MNRILIYKKGFINIPVKLFGSWWDAAEWIDKYIKKETHKYCLEKVGVIKAFILNKII